MRTILLIAFGFWYFMVACAFMGMWLQILKSRNQQPKMGSDLIFTALWPITMFVFAAFVWWYGAKAFEEFREASRRNHR